MAQPNAITARYRSRPCSVPDLTAGALGEMFNRYTAAGGIPDSWLIVPAPPRTRPQECGHVQVACLWRCTTRPTGLLIEEVPDQVSPRQGPAPACGRWIRTDGRMQRTAAHAAEGTHRFPEIAR